MTSERIKEIQQQTAYPDSISVQQALLQVWNECLPLPQQEISDEEIEKASQQTYPIKGGGNLPTRLDLDQYNKQIGFVSGIMWYRKKLGEQLKNIL
jgi:hypothetical protein